MNTSLHREAAASLADAGRTPWQALILESGAVHEFGRLFMRAPALWREPRGDGHAIMVLPGYGQSDTGTHLLRYFLNRKGYRAHGWGQGRNDGNSHRLLEELDRTLMAHTEHSGEPVSLVGWSMGGFLARELALLHPDRVRRVITLGTPLLGGPKYTVFADYYRQSGLDLDAVENRLREQLRHRGSLRVPVTAVFSRRDGIVAWQACIDPFNAGVEHIEVSTSHIGLGFNADVYALIARRLALSARNQPDGDPAAIHCA